MTEISRIFINDSLYHIYNRGIEKRSVFIDDSDYRHFLRTLVYYQQAKTSIRFSVTDFQLTDRSDSLRFNVIAYCLMPNHFHFILQQLIDDGIKRGMAQILNSYTKYFNTKYSRVGPLFQGRFKSVNVISNEQLIHLSRYIFLNPYASQIVNEPKRYRWSSFNEYLNPDDTFQFCQHDLLLSQFVDRKQLKKFVLDYADYARCLEQIKHDVLD